MNNKKAQKRFRKRERRRAILYYIYPKTQDMQKFFMFIMGAIGGLILHAGTIRPDEETLSRLFYVFVLIELLLYAARYQINDIRGAWEDANDFRRTGLPLISKSNSFNVKFSLVITGIKFCLATGMLVFLLLKKDASALPLTIIVILIIVSTVLYEKVRISMKYRYLIIPFVGLGYPLRFLAGVLTVFPRFFATNLFLGICLCAAYYSYGITVATLPWAFEALQHKTGVKQSTGTCRQLYENDTPEPVLKKLFHGCTWVVDDHCKIPNAAEAGEYEIPFDRKRLLGWQMPWNTAYVITAIILGLVFVGNIKRNMIWIWFMLFILISINGQIANGVLSRITAILSYLFPMTIWYIFGQRDSLIAYLCVTQIIFMATYHYLLYFFDSTVDFEKMLIGSNTADWINTDRCAITLPLQDKNNKEETIREREKP